MSRSSTVIGHGLYLKLNQFATARTRHIHNSSVSIPVYTAQGSHCPITIRHSFVRAFYYSNQSSVIRSTILCHISKLVTVTEHSKVAEMVYQTPTESVEDQSPMLDSEDMYFAVVGMGCRLPGSATSPEKLWELLSTGRSAWTQEPPDGRFNMKQFYDPQIGKLGSLFTKGAHFLKQDISLFDRKFFNISATEATAMDPQTRLLLEIAYETFENAGYSLEQLKNTQTGVFVGSWLRDYHLHLERDPENAPMYESTGTAAAIVSNRISHFYDLKGPSFTVDTACSSSLVALHQALLSMKNGDADSAFVGGVNLILDPTTSMSLGRMRLLSPDGRSYAFDERANGYGRGEGIGGIFLKPLTCAQRDGDSIRAIIRSSAINQDGQTPGITFPSGTAQELVIQRAYKSGKLSPDADYVECHGTGTAAGDPIETKAVASVLARWRAADDALAIGSIKSNIGHLEAASGIAGIIKSVLMLEKGEIPPQALLENLTSAIDFHKLKLKPSRELYRPQKLDRISVNSFGFGGTNAHIVVEKAPLRTAPMNGITRSKRPEPPQLALLSASSEQACKKLAANLSRFVIEHPEVEESSAFCRDLAFTLSKRSLLPFRVAFTYASLQELLEKLDQVQSGTIPIEKGVSNHKSAFVFTGQGAQWYAMARELIEGCEQFRQSIDRAAMIFRDFGCDWDLAKELVLPEAESRVSDPALSQPICTAIQICIVDLTRRLQLNPCAVVGHSSGEMAAAYAAGAISFEDALASAYYRGLFVSEAIRGGTIKGSMLAVGLDAAKTEEFIAQVPEDEFGTVMVACHNSPSSVTVSGDEAAVIHLHKTLQREQMFSRLLKTNGAAYHSYHMRPIAQKLSDALAQNKTSKPDPNVRWVSSVTSEDCADQEITGDYWVKNLVSPVLFRQALEKVCRVQSPPNTLVEIGPHSALAGPIKQTLKSIGQIQSVRYTNALTRNQNAMTTFLDMVGTLAVRGEVFDLLSVHTLFGQAQPTLLTNLPSYAWDHDTKFWHESRLSAEYYARTFPRHELLGTRSPDFSPSEPSWRNYIRLSELTWLKGHAVHDQVIWPGAGFIAMAVEAVRQVWASRGQLNDEPRYILRDVVFSKALVLRDNADDVEINFRLRPLSTSASDSSSTWSEFRAFSIVRGAEPQEHCRGLIALESDKVPMMASANAQAISKATAKSPMDIAPADFYRTFRAQGMGWRDAFAGLTNISAGPEASVCDVRLLPDITSETAYRSTKAIHPGTLDSVFQATFATMIAGDQSAAKVITAIDELEISLNAEGQSNNDLRVLCVASDRGFDIGSIPDPSMPFHVRMKGFQITEVPGESSDGSEGQQTCFNLEWQPVSPEIVQKMFPDHAEGAQNESLTNGTGSNGTHFDKPLTNGHAKTAVFDNSVDSEGQLECTRAEVQLIGNKDDTMLHELGSALRKSGDHNMVEAQSWDTVSTASTTCVILDTIQSPLLSNLHKDHFLQFQGLIKQATNILWITQDGTGNCNNPSASTVAGFASTLRAENPALRLVTLDVDRDNLSVLKLVPLIDQVLQGRHFDAEAEISDLDCELAYHGGQLSVPRVVVNDTISNYLTQRSSNPEAKEALFFQNGRSLKLAAGQPGLLDSLRWEDQQESSLIPEADEVIFETRAHGANFRDLLVAIGQLGNGKDAVMAGECSGIITAVGKNLESEFKLGDRVCSFGAQAYANYARVPGHRCIKIPESISFEVAATVPIVYSTVVYAFLHVAHIERGSRVLIHSATGGVGQVAVKLAHHIGAEVFATVGSAEKRKLLVEEFGVAEDHIFSSRDTAFKQGIMELTDGTGVDMVLNSLTGEMFRESCNCLASFGHFVEIGKRDLLANSRMEMRFFLKNASFTAMDLMVIGKQKPALCKRLMNEAMQLVATRAITPIKMISAPLSDVSTIFRQMQGGKHVGKIVLTADRDTQVKVVPPPTKGAQFDANSSYLAVGGLGGLGRTMIRWMARRGAKHIITMSRTGLKSAATQSLVKEMQAHGTSLHVLECDASNAASVKTSLDEIETSTPPIRGIIQAAMVLRDSMFEEMTHAQWQAATLPKIQGTQNLHEYFTGKNLDFFIMLSSVISVVGNTGQAAYGAANSYLDGLARYRNTQGLTGHTINVGVVSDAGVVSQNEDLARMLRSKGFNTITVKDLLHLLDYVIINSKPTTPTLSQTIMGLGAGGLALRGPKFANWLEACGANTQAETSASNNKNELRMAGSVIEAQEIACAALILQLGRLLSVDATSIDASQTLASYGIDSLISVELRNWIRVELKAAVPLLELNEAGRTIVDLAKVVAARSTLVQGL